MEWTYTAEADREKVAPCRTVDVCIDKYGEAWVGLTFYTDPKDFTFEPREQYGTGEVGLRVAKQRADSWARELAFDATR